MGVLAVAGVSGHPVGVLAVAGISTHPVGVLAIAGVSGHPVSVLAVAGVSSHPAGSASGRHSTHLSYQVLEAAPRDARVSHFDLFRQVGAQDVHAHLEVGLVEVVQHVPPDLAVLAPLLDDRVEEGKHEDEGREGGVFAVPQRIHRDLEVRVAHV